MREAALNKLFVRFRDRRDGKALAAVFDFTARELLSVAAHLVGRQEEAEDLVQLVFLRAIERAATFDEAYGLRGWLYGILWREAAKLRRGQARRPEADPIFDRVSADPARVAEQQELPQVVLAALERLPRHYREVVEPVLLQDKPARQIADELGRAPGTVRVQIQRGLEKLRRALPRDMASWAAVALPLRGLEAVRGSILQKAGLSVNGAGRVAVLAGAASAVVTTLPAGWAVAAASVGVGGLLYAAPLGPASPELHPPSEPEAVVRAFLPETAHPADRRLPIRPVPRNLPVRFSSLFLVAPLAATLLPGSAPAQSNDARRAVAVETLEVKIERLETLVAELLEVAESDGPQADVAWRGLEAAIRQVEKEYERRRQAAQETRRHTVDQSGRWVEAVSKIGDPAGQSRALAEMQAALASGVEAEQIAALRALARLAEVKFDRGPLAQPVRGLAEQSSGELAVAALYALNSNGRRPEDLPLALRLAEDPSPEAGAAGIHLIFVYSGGELTGAAGQAVERLLATDDYSELRQRLSGLWGSRVSPQVEARLLELSRSENSEQRHDAIYYALSTLRDKSRAVVERLIEATQGSDPNSSGRALWGLGHGVPAEQAPLVAEAMRALFEARDAPRLQEEVLGLIARYGGVADQSWLIGIGRDEARPDRVREAALSAAESVAKR